MAKTTREQAAADQPPRTRCAAAVATRATMPETVLKLAQEDATSARKMDTWKKHANRRRTRRDPVEVAMVTIVRHRFSMVNTVVQWLG